MQYVSVCECVRAQECVVVIGKVAIAEMNNFKLLINREEGLIIFCSICSTAIVCFRWSWLSRFMTGVLEAMVAMIYVVEEDMLAIT